MNKWERIEKYDKLPANKRPKRVVFRFKPVENERAYTSLKELIDTERHRGFRVCTHWLELPPIEDEET